MTTRGRRRGRLTATLLLLVPAGAGAADPIQGGALAQALTVAPQVERRWRMGVEARF